MIYRAIAVLALCAIVIPAQAGSSFIDSLSEEERAWLKDNPEIRLAPDPDFPPFEYFDEQGEYRGMAADYIKLLESRLGVRFEIIQLKSWDEVLAQARAHKIDMFGAAAETPQRLEYMRFTPPHMVMPGVIVTARDFAERLTLDNLRTMKVAVVSGYVWHDLIVHRYPEIRLVIVPDITTGLQMTSFGLADAMVGDMATTSHFIHQEGITNLRVGTRLKQQLELALATRRDWPELNTILEKALTTITPAEHERIRSRWIRLESPSLFQSKTFWTAILAVSGGLGLIILVIALWNRTLKRQVDRRTRDLRAAQMQLIQAAKLESVGRLAAGVAHEVKNPLAIIQMGIDYLRGVVNITGEDAQAMTDMEDAVTRADTVIKGLLDFSREKKLLKQKKDINEVIRESLRFVSHELKQRNIELKEYLEPTMPEFEMDPNKLQQVFINLFTNAAQAMGKDGHLIVRSNIKALNTDDLNADAAGIFRQGERAIVIQVEDTGPGIDEAKVAKVFDPFFTTKPVGQGTGLGLSVSRNIIELHGGTIVLRNRASDGASAVLMFKISDGA